MDFRLFLDHKFINSSSVVCGHCNNHLYPLSLAKTDKHIYKIGQLFSCTCGKSSILSNFVRGIKNLIDSFEHNCNFSAGFCSDLKCGKCHSTIYPLENGVKPPVILNKSQRADRYGCLKCLENQNILLFGNYNDPEKDTSRLMNWYTKHIDDLKKMQ